VTQPTAPGDYCLAILTRLPSVPARLLSALVLVVVVIGPALVVAGPAGQAAARPAKPSTSGARTAATPTTAPPAPPALKASILVDADTGNVLDGLNSRTPLPPASLTKVLTALTAINTISPTASIPVSARAEAAPADKMFMKQGQIWTFDQLIHCLLLASANDAAIALAEQAGGSLEGFQAMFAATARSLGLEDQPVLKDPAGLDGPSGVDGGNLISPRDLAIAARALLTQPVLAQIVATPVYYFPGPDNVQHRLTNHNKLFLTTYPGAIGVKTGFTDRAGACLIAAARRDGRTLIAVVMHGSNPTQSAQALLDKGFATPVMAEPTTDRLPAVTSGAPAPAPSTTISPAPAPATGNAAGPVHQSAVHKARTTGLLAPLPSSWPLRIAVVVFGGVGVALLVTMVRRPRRTPRYPRPGR
jgi:D-alanyl-D-alanine carboxypeptidase (penicillin-binding protein 5/6)